MKLHQERTKVPQLPLPPPPANEIALFAHALAGAIRRGMKGEAFATFCRLRLGLDYARKGAAADPADVLAQFDAIPEAREAIEPVRDQVQQFWQECREKFRSIVAKEDGTE